MNIILLPKTVFIIEVEDALSQSLRCLLETHERAVRIYRRCEEFWAANIHRDQDVVLLNFEPRRSNGFKMLDRLLSSSRRPQIVITSPPDSVFKKGDIFPGGRVTILFHPVTPKHLVETIASM